MSQPHAEVEPITAATASTSPGGHSHKIRVIKKYPNRRLYDSSISSYVTLNDIRDLVIKDTAFRVIDARSQEDLTRATLLQVLQEQEETGTPIFPAAVLSYAIRARAMDCGQLAGDFLHHQLRRLADFELVPTVLAADPHIEAAVPW